MVNVIYNRDIPDGPNNPSQDQPKMKTNTNSIDSLISIDHLGFGNNQGGYHGTVHQPIVGTWTQTTRTAAPPLVPIPGVNQIIAMNVTPDSTGAVVDTQLFAMTGGSNGTTQGVNQLTGNLLGTDGYCWIGGLLIQWGLVVNATTIGSVTFKDRVPGAIPFPNACFIVNLSFSGIVGPLGSIASALVTNTGFTWAKNTSNSFSWIALGV